MVRAFTVGLGTLFLFLFVGEGFAGYCTENYSCNKICTRRISRTRWFRTRYSYQSYTCKGTCTRRVCCKGYSGNTCTTDIDECAKRTHNCAHTCINTHGSFRCACRTGYKLSTNGISCIPLCYGSTSCPNGGTCVAPDSCSCRTGYAKPKCSDVDECKGRHGCAHNCINTKGSYRCSCRPGFSLYTDGRRCKGKYCDQKYTCYGTCYRQVKLSTSRWWRRARYGRQGYKCAKTCTRKVCCTGYKGSLCAQPICHGSDTCPNGGLCYTPNTCQCKTGFSGSRCSDIDECRTRTHGCKQGCTNTHGSYRCYCRSGYELASDGKTCNDINECTKGTHRCSKTCTNTLGSYVCSCPKGYTLGSDRRSCFDVNECAGNHGCQGTCQNTLGSYSCMCGTGYTLHSNKRACVDINECTGKHGCSNSCHNTKGSYYCSCPRGYTLGPDRRSCVDKNECALNQHGCAGGCSNTIGSYMCTCKTGFRLSTDGRNCVDIDECLIKTHDCHQVCVNTKGSYFCICNTGYSVIKGNQCIDNDECKAGTHGCTHTCTNTEGSFQCLCNNGYTLSSDGKTCVDINECHLKSHKCHPEHQHCTNRPGTYVCQDVNECKDGSHGCDHLCVNLDPGYQCKCRDGYRLGADGKMCQDINECEEKTDGCGQTCRNTEGSYECTCLPGFLLGPDEKVCSDIDECAAGTHGCSDICTNSIGSYKCSCNNGYVLAGAQRIRRSVVDGKTCVDKDECLENKGGCSHTCTNMEGTYECSCPDGYLLRDDDHTCTDINECIAGTHDCSQNCKNTPGSFECSCKQGYSLAGDEKTCEDIDECENNNGGCSDICTDTEGSYQCSCPVGHLLGDDGRTCVDINECADGNGGCSDTCTNTEGSFTCSCPAGHQLGDDGKTCHDVDECTLNKDECASGCSNTIGSYSCKCETGYHLAADGRNCVDNNECLLGTDNCHQTCANTKGSFVCGCKDGYTMQGDKCIDVDECKAGTHGCAHTCTNTEGSFQCSCNHGYTLGSDGNTCVDIDECHQKSHTCKAGSSRCNNTAGSYHCDDIDECTDGTHDCDQVCVNKAPSFECSCNDGYGLAADGKSCHDIDECADDIDGCEHNCQNTEGSFECSCNPGHQLGPDGKLCPDINECMGSTHGCSTTCINKQGSYHCACDLGHTLGDDGKSCVDEDECLLGTSGCGHTCTNTEGSFECSCSKGYLLGPDEKTCIDKNECDDGSTECDQICSNTPGSYECSCNLGFKLADDGKTCDACPDGTYGENCAQTCGHCLEGDACDKETGDCTSAGCAAGWQSSKCDTACADGMYGQNCPTPCGSCKNGDPCDKVTGACPDGCEVAGLLPPTCAQQTPCTDGTYGLNCAQTCGHCLSGTPCDKETGACTGASGGCAAGWQSSTCDTACDVGAYGLNCAQTCGHCLNGDTCDKVNGACTLVGCAAGWKSQTCDIACADGTYGTNCAQTCGHCLTDTPCDKETGACSTSGCTAGWQSATCNTDIDECEGNHGCEQNCVNKPGSYECSCNPGYALASDSKTCIACTDGTYGLNCAQTCGHCLSGTPCDKETGACTGASGGCAAGWQSSTCDTACGDGTYGLNCAQTCGNCLNGNTCDKVTGACTGASGGCKAGWQSPNCNTACADGTYGTNCAQTCGHCLTDTPCDKETGACSTSGCAAGWQSATCNTDIDECEGSTHGCEQNCFNKQGSYECSCNAGYALASNSKTCIACADGTYGTNCAQTCGHCLTDTPCDKETGACSTSGCTAGWQSATCNTDIDECTLGSHGCEQNCVNKPGSYECSCNPGYALASDSKTCIDVEPDCHTSGCEHTCIINALGSMTCVCSAGYRLDSDGKKCNDIDECLDNTAGCSHGCTNTQGSFECSCPVGYQLGDDKVCSACGDGTYGLNCAQTCGNCLNGNTCDKVTGACTGASGGCKAGWQSPNCNTACADGTYGTNCAQTCGHCLTNTPCDKETGACSTSGCAAGWQSATCNTDIDECEGSTHGCEQNCVNKQGSYECSCNAGYALASDSKTCIACADGTYGTNCAQTCGHCLTDTPCDKETGACSTSGCAAGWESATCNTDIDECEGSTHGCEQNCVNKPGSYECSCKAGYALASDSKTCIDIDECLDNTAGCSHGCTNTQGSFECSCPVGYQLGDDDKVCSESGGDDEPGTITNCIDACSLNNWGHKVVLPGTDCAKYCDCAPLTTHTNGTVQFYWQEMPCGLNTKWDGALKTCVHHDENYVCNETVTRGDGNTGGGSSGGTGNGPTAANNCPAQCMKTGWGDYTPLPGYSCTLYCHCAPKTTNEDGSLEFYSQQMSCSPGTLWNDTLQICDHAHEVQCQDSSSGGGSDGGTTDDGCKCEALCRHADWGSIVVMPGTGCKKYCHCAPLKTYKDGSLEFYWQEMSCGAKTLWDKEANTCNHDYLVTCPEDDTTELADCSSGGGTDPSGPGSCSATCIHGNWGSSTVLGGSDCAKYCVCDSKTTLVDGSVLFHAVQMPCAPGTIWDIRINHCNHESQVECSTGSTPDGSGNNGDGNGGDGSGSGGDGSGSGGDGSGGDDEPGIISNCIDACSLNNWGHKVVLPGTDCAKYCDCAPLTTHTNGTVQFYWQEMPCGLNTKWDGALKTCVHHDENFVCNETVTRGDGNTGGGSSGGTGSGPTAANNCPAQCMKTGWGDYTPLPGYSCTQYCHCAPETTNTDGSLEFYSQQMPCSPGTLWNDTLQICDHAHAVKCQDSSSGGGGDGGTTDDGCKCEALCRHADWGSIVVMPGTGCKKYCHCAPKKTYKDGSLEFYWQEMSCGAKTLWDKEANTCNHDYLVTCPGDDTTELADCSSGGDGEGSGSGTDPSGPGSCSATCSHGNWGSSTVLGGSDCAKYCVCDSKTTLLDGSSLFHAVQMPCAPGTIWDIRINNCNHESQVECSIGSAPDGSGNNGDADDESGNGDGSEDDSSVTITDCSAACNHDNWGYDVVLPGSNCTKYCDCAPLTTYPNGTVQFYWQEMPCPTNTRWDGFARTCIHHDDDFVCNETITHGSSNSGGSNSGDPSGGSGASTENNCPALCGEDEWGQYTPLPGYSCTMYCHCAPATTKEDGSVSFYTQQMPCSPGTLWNNTIQTCDHAHAVQCQDTSSGNNGDGDGGDSTEDDGKCEALCRHADWGGIVVMPGTDCRKYCHCAPLKTYEDGSLEFYWQSMKCAPGTRWHKEKNTCNHEDNVKCNDTDSGNSGGSGDGGTGGDGSGTDPSVAGTCSATCNNDHWNSTTVLGGSDCNKYCVCANKRTLVDGSTLFNAVEMPCPTGTRFDVTMTLCNHANQVTCASGGNESGGNESDDP